MLRTRLMPLGALVVLIASACGGSNNTSSSSSSSGAAGKPDLAAILRYQGVVGPSQDPIKVGQTCEPLTLHAIYDGLFDYDANNVLVPELATGYQLMSGNVLRVALRKGVQFQDNTPFNADAVVFNLTRVMTDPASTIKGMLADVQSVSTVDDSTVDITMKRAAVGTVLPNLADRAGLMVSPTAVKNAGSQAAFAQHPVGAGMYQVTGTIVSRQSMSVRRWNGYWNPSVQLLGGIDFSEIPFTSLDNAIKAGDVDWVSPQSVADGDALKGASGIKLLEGPGTQFRLLVMNETMAPFNNDQLRQAVSYAIDRPALAKALTEGQAKATWQEFPPSSPAYDPNLDKNPPFPHDTAKAKQLLQTAGFPNGFSFDAYVGSSATSFVQMGELMAAQLQQVGITMNVKTVDIATAFPTIYLAGPTKHGIAQAASYGGVASPDPDSQFHAHYLSDGTTNAGGNDAPGLRQLITQAESTADQSQRYALYRQANDLVVNEVQDGVPLFYDPAITAIRNYVGGVSKAVQYCSASFRGVFINQGKAAIG